MLLILIKVSLGITMKIEFLLFLILCNQLVDKKKSGNYLLKIIKFTLFIN